MPANNSRENYPTRYPSHPDVIPKPTDDTTIANEVLALHKRMAGPNGLLEVTVLQLKEIMLNLRSL